MFRLLIATLSASALFAAGAAAETDKPAKPEKPAASKPNAASKPEKAAVKVNRVSYACEGGVTLTVTYPPEAQAKTRPVKIAMKDTTYFVRPGKESAAGKYENAKIKLVFETKGDEAVLAREGKPLAEKCKAAKPGS
jgi:membrane-bound inhibitor of C-type lysozyme